MNIASEEQLASRVLTEFPLFRRILVIAPHPDDEVFGCGGTLAKLKTLGAHIVVIIATDGALGGDDERGSLVELRAGESRAAAQILGLETPQFWRLPDRGLTYGEILIERLMEAVRETAAEIVFLPSPTDWHPDHQTLAFAGAEAVRRLGSPLHVAFFEVTDPLPSPNLICDISAFEVVKAKAMSCFLSQLEEQPYDRRIAGINRFRAMHLGPRAACAEAFHLVSADELEKGLVCLLEGPLALRRTLGFAASGDDLPLVSVIVRSMDRATLDEALNSLALQTWPNIEIVLVNARGGGHRSVPDRWGRLPLRYVSHDQPLHRCHSANLGLDTAVGKYLMFLDDDDWFEVNHVARLIDALQQNPGFRLAYTGVRLVDKCGLPLPETLAYPFDDVRLLAGNYIPIHAALFDRSLTDEGCRFDESLDLYEDWDFWLQVARVTPFLHVEGLSAAYRIDRQTGSGVHANSDKVRRIMLAVFRKWQAVLTDDQCTSIMEAIQTNRERGAHITRLEHVVADSASVADALTRNLAERDSEVVSLKGQLAECDTRTSDLQKALTQRNAQVASHRDSLADALLRIQVLESSLEQARAEITLFLNSRSFRLTRPLRQARRRGQQVANVLRLARHWIDHRGGVRRGLPQLIARSWGVLVSDGPKGFVDRLKDHARRSGIGGGDRRRSAAPQRITFQSGSAALPDVPPVDYRFWQAFRLPCAVDIIVCVHNALGDVKLCLSSVVRYSAPCRLILVDDGSGNETRDYLRAFAREQGATLLRNDVARGYTFAANQGLRASTGGYVVLLNSDTVTTLGWIEKLVACAESAPEIGLVGPLSNTASWQSIPEIQESGDWAVNSLPPGMTTAEMASMVARYSSHCYPRMSFLNGFCLLIRRAVIEHIGLFDEAAFGRGYGEENDYCLRARKAGWELALADNAYVFHAQSKSYNHEKRKALADHAGQQLTAKHGDEIIAAGVEQCLWDRQLLSIRAQARTMFERDRVIRDGRARWEGRRVLFVLPIIQVGGGGNVVITEARAMMRMGVTVALANLSLHRDIFEQGYPDLDVPVIYVDSPDEIGTLGREFDAVIATAFYSVEWLTPLLTAAQVTLGYYVQDFEPLFFEPGTHNHEQALGSYTRIPGIRMFTKTGWNRDELLRHTGFVAEVVGPSYDCDLFRPRVSSLVDSRHPVKVLAMVRPSTPRRNPEGTLRLLTHLQQRFGDRIEIAIFGGEQDSVSAPMGSDELKMFNHGELRPGQIANLMATCDLFIDMSHFQAMGLTAMEAMACGVVPIVPRAGGASSFACHNENAAIVDTEKFEEVLAAASGLIEDSHRRRALQVQGMNDIVQHFPERSASAILACLFPA